MDYKRLLLTIIILVILDVMFLYFASPLYNNVVRNVQGNNINAKMLALLLIYLIVPFQIYYFIIKRNANMMDAFILGCTTYGIFELTNYTIFDKWDPSVVMIDIVWGGILYYLTTFIFRQLERKLI